MSIKHIIMINNYVTFFFFLTCPHKRGEGGFELVTSALLGVVQPIELPLGD
jgi:hypothetical protein